MNELVLQAIEFLKMAEEEAKDEADIWRLNWHILELGRFYGNTSR